MQKKGEIGVPEKPEIIDNLAKKARKKKILRIAISVLILIVVVLLFYAGLKYFSKPKTSIEIGAELENVLISENGKTAFVKLKAGINEGDIVYSGSVPSMKASESENILDRAISFFRNIFAGNTGKVILTGNAVGSSENSSQLKYFIGFMFIILGIILAIVAIRKLR